MELKVSILHDLKTNSRGETFLDKGTVSQVVSLHSFDDLADLVEGLKYPVAGHGSDESYGICPTPMRPIRTLVADAHLQAPCQRYDVKYNRKATHDLDRVGFFYADIDNANRLSLARTGSATRNPLAGFFNIHSSSTAKFKTAVRHII